MLAFESPRSKEVARAQGTTFKQKSRSPGALVGLYLGIIYCTVK